MIISFHILYDIDNQNHYSWDLMVFKTFLILILLLYPSESFSFPKILWVYWESGFTQDIVVNLCSKNHHAHLQLKGWDIRQLNSTSVFQWLSKIPDFHGFPSTDTSIENGQIKANYIRLFLLYYYGGVWIDATIILVEDFDWLQNIEQNPNIEPHLVSSPKVFMFHLDQYGSEQFYIDEKDRKILLSPGLQTWFIAASPKTDFIKEVLEQYILFLSRGLQYKNTFLQREGISTRKMDNMNNYMTFSQSIQTVLQLRQKLFDKIYGVGVNRKLSLQEYGILTINSVNGPHLLQKQVWWDANLFTRMIFGRKISELQARNLKPKYLIKVSRPYYLTIKSILEGQSFSTTLMNLITRKTGVSQVSWNRLFCPQIQAIIKGSILDKQLLEKDVEYEKNWKPLLTQFLHKPECQPNKYMKGSLILVPVLLLLIILIHVLKFFWSKDSEYVQIKMK